MTASGTAGDLSLDSDGGDIGATAITSPLVVADAGGGDITISFAQVPRDVTVNSGGGNIIIEESS